MSWQEDYILRLIQNVGVMLRRIMDLMQAGSSGEALEESEQAIGLIVGVDASVADAMGVPSLTTFLRVGAELDVPRCILLGRVFAARADAMEAEGDAEGGRRQRLRAAEILRIARQEARPDEAEEIEAVLGDIFAAE